MEQIALMSEILYSHVEQIDDVKTCIINNVETTYYKVQWKCTWEPETVLQKFCGNIVDKYKETGNNHRATYDSIKNKEESSNQARLSEVANFIKESEIAYLSNDESENSNSVEQNSNYIQKNLKKTTNKNNTETACYANSVLDRKLQNNEDFNEAAASLSATQLFYDIHSLPDSTYTIINNQSFNNGIKPEPEFEIFQEIDVLNDNGKSNDTKTKNVAELLSADYKNYKNNNSFNSVNNQNIQQSLVKNPITMQSNEPNLYSTKSNPIEHVTNKHVTNDKLYDCRFSVDTQDNIQVNSLIDKHMETNNQISPLIRRQSETYYTIKLNCQLCSYSTLSTASFKLHIQDHVVKNTQKKKYQCKICSFITMYERRFKCHLLKTFQNHMNKIMNNI